MHYISNDMYSDIWKGRSNSCGVQTDNQRERISGPCRFFGCFEEACHKVHTALIVVVQCFRKVFKYWPWLFVRNMGVGIRLVLLYIVLIFTTTWHSETCPYKVTTSFDKTSKKIVALLPNLTLLPTLILLTNSGKFPWLICNGCG